MWCVCGCGTRTGGRNSVRIDIATAVNRIQKSSRRVRHLRATVKDSNFCKALLFHDFRNRVARESLRRAFGTGRSLRMLLREWQKPNPAFSFYPKFFVYWPVVIQSHFWGTIRHACLSLADVCKCRLQASLVWHRFATTVIRSMAASLVTTAFRTLPSNDPFALEAVVLMPPDV